jgi:N-acetylmuramoyl-L-alanine amidase
MAEVCTASDLDKDTMTRTLWGEARGEPQEGQIAVAWVIRTRALWEPTWWGYGVRGVCLKPKQFSCWNLDDPNYEKLKALVTDDPEYVALRQIALAVLEDELPNPAPGATHYRNIDANAEWSVGREGVKIGNLVFFAIGPNG